MATSHQAHSARTWWLGAAGAGCALLLAACGTAGFAGSAGPAPRPTTSPAAAAACPHLTSLRQSLSNLTQLQLSPASAGQMGADLSNIEMQMGALRSLGGAAGGSEAAQLTAALRKFALAAQAEVGQPTAARLSALQSALAGVKSSAQPLIQQLSSACPAG